VTPEQINNVVQSISSTTQGAEVLKVLVAKGLRLKLKKTRNCLIVCTHSEHQARTVNILHVSETQDCGSIQKPVCTKVLKRENVNVAPMAALTSLILHQSHRNM
jgi:hypothetical protein